MKSIFNIHQKRITNIPYVLVLVIICCIVLPLGFVFAWYEYWTASRNLAFQKDESAKALQSELVVELENNYALLEYYYKNAEAKLEKEVELEAGKMQGIIDKIVWRERKKGLYYSKNVIKHELRDIRFGEGKGYYFAFSKSGIIQLLPAQPHLEGRSIFDLQDGQKTSVIREIIRTTDKPRGGTVRYPSLFPDEHGKYTNKIAYVKIIPALGWIAGAAEFVSDVEDSNQKIYLDIIDKINFHRSDFHFVADASERFLMRFLSPETEAARSRLFDRISMESKKWKEGCFRVTVSNNEYLICTHFFEPWNWVVGFGVATKRIDNAYEKNKVRLKHKLLVELFCFVLILIIAAAAAMFLGNQMKKNIVNGFAVFSDFFETAIQKNTRIDVGALEVAEFKQMAVYANKMVDNLAQRDITIRNYTGELERANKKLEEMASRDGLTGVYNRRYFDEIYEREVSRAKRNRLPLALFMIDIDFFKAYNDTYGHQEGDAVLIQVANALDQTLKRPADLLARYGGEEFVVLLPDTDEAGAVIIARAMHKGVADLAIPHQSSGVDKHVTFSMGICVMLPKFPLSSVELLNKADQALYQAKKQGRNRYVINC